MKAWRGFSWILISSWIGKINVTPLFLLKIIWNFLCKILEPQPKKIYKIVIVKIAIKVTQISNFSKFKVQGLDIATLLGAEDPQKGLKGPRGPKGPPALRRR